MQGHSGLQKRHAPFPQDRALRDQILQPVQGPGSVSAASERHRGKLLGADGALPVLAYRDARVVLPDIGWSLEPVFLLRRQFHLKEHSAEGDQLRALVAPSSDITAHLEHV